MSDKDFLVAGLGNIGAEYARTRHNIGFMVLDAWAQASNILFATGRYGDLAVISVKGRRFHLLKPSTYMNLSGNALRYWQQALDIPMENIMVICDDINLPFGTLRMRTGGSDGGHNGLKNIEELLGTRDYARIRMGVGHEFEDGRQIDFVLGTFSEEQEKMLPELCKTVIGGVTTWALAGAQRAMTEINTRKKQAE
ncbi:MAG: aminoacyl-tRNA hydrolase [Bacteroidales bacterium]|nr:aminoacyl-tRNA hydrolase [Bacteroidales bacterium]